MFGQGSSGHIGSLWRVELDFLCVNQILNLVSQSPTIICSMPRAVRMISAANVGVIPWRRPVGILWRVHESYQLSSNCGKICDKVILSRVYSLLGLSPLGWLGCRGAAVGFAITTALTVWRRSGLFCLLGPYTALASFLKGFFSELEDAPFCIFPDFIPASILSPVRMRSVNPAEELPMRWLKNGPDRVPKNMSTSSRSVNGGCTLISDLLSYFPSRF